MCKKLFCLLLFLLFVFNSSALIYAQNEKTSSLLEIPEGYIFYHYKYDFLDISLIFPEDWLNSSSKERGILLDTPDSKGSIVILGTPLFEEDFTLEKLWARSKENLGLAGATFQEFGTASFAGYPAIKALHSIKIGNETNQYLQYSTIVGDLFYTFSFQAPINEFEKYLKEVQTIVQSIIITVPSTKKE